MAITATVGAAIFPFGCDAGVYPDQNLFVPLEVLSESDEAVVRLYHRPRPGLWSGRCAYVVRGETGGGSSIRSLGVVDSVLPPSGYIIKNREEPEGDLLGSGGVRVLAELRGDAATGIIDFLETRSEEYPCVSIYEYFGRNSNTWTQWVLDQVGWAVELPPTAVGKDAECR